MRSREEILQSPSGLENKMLEVLFDIRELLIKEMKRKKKVTKMKKK
ncbi:hypothetical protein LCGC14_0365490 [marine sediment metagenome]|uniref:Uncharacterized protein n=1 Tax=marine sediment metagenome TaxID=412755 RepID=A0A0F9WF47_9ZZZZ